MPIATLWHVTIRAIQDWWKDNCLRLAASLAYYTALSLAPLLLLIVGVAGLVLDRGQVAHQLTTQLESLMGPAGRELVTSILAATSPQEGTIATVIGLITLFIGATAVFGELQSTMNLIWEVQPAPNQWGMGRALGLASVARLLAGHRLCAGVSPPGLARHQRRTRQCSRSFSWPGTGGPEPYSGDSCLAPSPYLRVYPTL
jgi:uncharacterized BrkB/YihY/UPF0761 family membrane protein